MIRAQVKPYDITIREQELFRRYFVNMENSTYNFTNMFIWSIAHSIKFTVVEDCLALLFQHPHGPVTVGYPIGDGDKEKAIDALKAFVGNMGLRLTLRNLSRWMVDELESLMPGRFEYIPDDAASDYVYETESLVTLRGKKLHAKRNHVNYFRSAYEFTYEPLTESDIDECKALFERWYREKDENVVCMEESKPAAFALLDHYFQLPVRGGAIKVGGKIVAFSIGEQITEDMALAHVEFATPELRGAFNIINQQFCEHEWRHLKYVNREEDMGLEGLRRAKQAYRPAFMVDKFTAVEKRP